MISPPMYHWQQLHQEPPNEWPEHDVGSGKYCLCFVCTQTVREPNQDDAKHFMVWLRWLRWRVTHERLAPLWEAPTWIVKDESVAGR